MRKKEKIIEVYEELHKNLLDYVNINKIVKKTGYNYRTVKKYLEIMKKLKLFDKPICEWHDEDIRRLE